MQYVSYGEEVRTLSKGVSHLCRLGWKCMCSWRGALGSGLLRRAGALDCRRWGGGDLALPDAEILCVLVY